MGEWHGERKGVKVYLNQNDLRPLARNLKLPLLNYCWVCSWLNWT